MFLARPTCMSFLGGFVLGVLCVWGKVNCLIRWRHLPCTPIFMAGTTKATRFIWLQTAWTLMALMHVVAAYSHESQMPLS
ncbi:hypothetical protein WV31_11235 [Magnetospirillum sp. ME-1]|nr:hypothetical protein WV31_11235 [Magnetospirillum sp. ME-1]